MIARPGEVALQDVEAPTCGPGDVVVRSRAAGVCGTDLEVLQATAGLRSGFRANALGPAAPEHYRSP